ILLDGRLRIPGRRGLEAPDDGGVLDLDPRSSFGRDDDGAVRLPNFGTGLGREKGKKDREWDAHRICSPSSGGLTQADGAWFPDSWPGELQVRRHASEVLPVDRLGRERLRQIEDEGKRLARLHRLDPVVGREDPFYYPAPSGRR